MWVWSTALARPWRRWMGAWMQKAEVSAWPSPSSTLPSLSTSNKPLAVTWDQWVP